MKLTIEQVGGGPVKFRDFAEANGLEMLVKERPASLMRGMGMGPGQRYYAQLRGIELKDGPYLLDVAESGATPEEAVLNYARRVAGELLVYRACHPERREIQAPNKWAAQ